MGKATLKLGEILVKEGILSEEDLKAAIKTQKAEGGKLGEVLVRLKMVKEEEITEALGKQLGIPNYSARPELLKPAADQGLEKLVPEDFSRTHLVLPLSKTLNSLTVAFADPTDLIVADNLKKMTRCEVNPVMATPTALKKAIGEFYGGLETLEKVVGASYEKGEISIEEVEVKTEELTLDKLVSKAEEAPVVKLVNLLLMQAIRDRVSDIHIEPFEKKFSLRFRIDGALYEVPPPAAHLYLPIVSRIKIMSKLDIAEKRLPQDGSLHLRVEDRLIDVRVSTMPTIYGEKVVMRILDKGAAPLSLEQLGFEKTSLEKFDAAIKLPYGLIFITGPTGSGKSTTLYAALLRIKTPRKNIITIEDPVEYRLEGINQVEVKPLIGLTFAAGLRSTLRQDPDVVLVGEVRDMETAEICIRAALTGHLVLSTLHTNDAPTAITRLIDIGVEPFLVASSLVLVVAQRLLRRLCPDCKQAYTPAPEVLKKAGFSAGEVKQLYKANGCEKCRGVGYRGRVGIYEVMTMSEEIREMIMRGESADKIRVKARESGMQTLWDAALDKVKQGITSLEEAYAVTYVG